MSGWPRIACFRTLGRRRTAPSPLPHGVVAGWGLGILRRLCSASCSDFPTHSVLLLHSPSETPADGVPLLLPSHHCSPPRKERYATQHLLRLCLQIQVFVDVECPLTTTWRAILITMTHTRASSLRLFVDAVGMHGCWAMKISTEPRLTKTGLRWRDHVGTPISEGAGLAETTTPSATQRARREEGNYADKLACRGSRSLARANSLKRGSMLRQSTGRNGETSLAVTCVWPELTVCRCWTVLSKESVDAAAAGEECPPPDDP